MSKVTELIKVAQQSGEPLFKGDVDGHPFHGNQYAAAAAAANEASSRARRTDNKNEHARAARLHWAASRLASKSDIAMHEQAARTHDLRAR